MPKVNCCKSKLGCKNRKFRDNSKQLRCTLGELQSKCCPTIPAQTTDEIKYEDYNYNGSFHKPLAHNTTDGRLISSHNYEKLVCSIRVGDQVTLASIPLAVDSTLKLVNPLASLSTALVGAPQCALHIDDPPTLSSDAGAAEMVEIYSQAFVRDVPFTEYNKAVITDADLITILDNKHMNKPDVLSSLKYYKPKNVAFTGKTLFRGTAPNEHVGPHISQLFLLNVPMGAGLFTQQYTTLLPRPAQDEWGINLAETILIQNGDLKTLPAPAVDPTKRYIFDGRSLAEAVHNDPAYQLFYQAALVLTGLGTSPNPGFPVYPNQSGFMTGFGGPSVICAVADVTALALKHAWYWKWQVSRKLRPDAFGMWVHDVKASLVSNAGNFDLSDVILNNDILNDINGLYGAYTLPVCYREGSPPHPSYPSGHAVISGACCTILKIFFNAEQLWSSLPGFASGALSGFPNAVVEADATGSALQSYTAQLYGGDSGSLTIAGEINKLGSNVSIGRDWAGIHYRSDAMQGMSLGEQVAIKYMEDTLSSMVENNLDGTTPAITFKRFSGASYTIKPTLCK